MASSTKSRQPRLRASCDGCFLAKVKCSKARPICSRCLSCGLECRYSPSSRAGKPKSDSNGHTHMADHPDTQQMHGLVEEKGIVYPMAHQAPSEHIFRIDTGWSSSPASLEGGMSRDPSISSGLGLLGVDERAMNEQETMSAPPELYSSTMPWTPPNDLPYTTAFADMPLTASHMSMPHMRSQSFDLAMANPMPWPEPMQQEMMSYSQVPTPTSISPTYFPSPAVTPVARPDLSRQKSSTSTIQGGSCMCFTICLQSLHALHNASSPASPPFDLVLSLNRKAVEGCAAMLSCAKCFGRSGPDTSTMLLATVIGKVTSFYQHASHSHFEPSQMSVAHNSPAGNMGVSLGVYQLSGEDGKWLELEILTRELGRLEEVYAKFRDVCTDLAERPEVTKAMIGYLDQTLGSTLEVLSHRKGEISFVS
ncbi:hypothetical protein GGR56DRAFT_606433 [Xylariaceae sp. FL0804]|nr:hypothetical protein GGR56DRAFT_606433 [Xylariaceae sp. FL0804]